MRNAILLLVAFFTLTGAGILPGKFETVDGPEATHLVSQSQGYIIYGGEPATIEVISLPSLKQNSIRLPGFVEDFYQLSGPDEEGRIAYLAEAKVKFYEKEKYIVALTTLSGKNHEVILSKEGEVWDAFALFPKLSPKGGRLAVFRETEPNSGEGIQQILDVRSKRTLVEFQIPRGGSRGISWFPDGEKIAYSKYVDHRELKGFDSYPEALQRAYANNLNTSYHWPQVTCIFIYDLRSDKHTLLRAGHNPIVSPDGKSILFQQPGIGLSLDYYLLNLETGEVRPVDWLGQERGAIAFTAPNVILDRGLPTTGRRHEILVGPSTPFLAVKLVDLTTGEFQTVIESAHPHNAISYGQVKKPVTVEESFNV